MTADTFTDMPATQRHSRPTHGERGPRVQTPHRERYQHARLRLEGLSSSFDAARLERRLGRQVGVIGVTVNSIVSCVYVAYDPALTSATLLVRQIEVSGFQVTDR